jgi:serine/threonine protein kinase
MAFARGTLSITTTWGLAISAIALAVLVEQRVAAAQPLVAIFVFAGFLATQLPLRQFFVLLTGIVVAMLFPLVISNGTAHVWDRMIGLVCLSLMACYQCIATRKPKQDKSNAATLITDDQNHGNSDRQNTQDAETWDGEAYHPPLVDAAYISNADSTTRLRKPAEDGQDSDSLSLEATPSDDRYQPIIDELHRCGAFDPEQLKKVGNALRALDLSQKSSDLSPLVLFQGQQIGSFKIETQLGQGGEGTIYRGTDGNGHTAAIKILHNMRVSDRFRREMQMVRQLAHRNIVTAYEVGEFQGLPFIAMELLSGPDLNQQVKQHGRLNWRTTTKYIMQIAHALSHAHQRELVHRDVKPANIILDGDGGVKLVDLGLASKASNDDGLHSVFQFVTQDGQLAGTLPFMAPEQAKALRYATQQSDIYSLGATWFYLLTGRGRLDGNTFEDQMRNLIIQRSFSDLEPGFLPERLVQVYYRMTAYRIEDRYADCEELIRALGDALVDLGEEFVLSNDVNVLVVEDSKADMILTLNLVRRTNASLKVHQASSLSAAFAVCEEETIDMVLLDLSLPDSTGIETILKFRERCQAVPLAVLTGLTEEQAESASLQAGADTFVSKEEITVRRMERVIFVTLSRCAGIARSSSL